MSEAETLDLRGVLCPTNFVYVKLKLEELEPGETVDVVLDDGEPMRNVPRSLKAEGHRIVQVQPEGGCYRLTVQRGAD